MFAPEGPTVRELAVQALSSVEHGYDLLAPKFDRTPFRTPVGPRTRDACPARYGPLRARTRPVLRDRRGVRRAGAGVPRTARRGRHQRGHAHGGPHGPPKRRPDLVRGDALALPFGPAFDLVVSFGAFGHFLPRQRPALFAQVHSRAAAGRTLRFPGRGSGAARAPPATGRCWPSTVRCGSATRCGGHPSSCTTAASALGDVRSGAGQGRFRRGAPRAARTRRALRRQPAGAASWWPRRPARRARRPRGAPPACRTSSWRCTISRAADRGVLAQDRRVPQQFGTERGAVRAGRVRDAQPVAQDRRVTEDVDDRVVRAKPLPTGPSPDSGRSSRTRSRSSLPSSSGSAAGSQIVASGSSRASIWARSPVAYASYMPVTTDQTAATSPGAAPGPGQCGAGGHGGLGHEGAPGRTGEARRGRRRCQATVTGRR